MMIRLYYLLAILLFSGSVFSQIPVAGSWRDHLPYNRCSKVVMIGNKIYCATKNNIFTYNTTDNSLEKLSKITGLSDIGVSTMEFSQQKGLLLIAYDNGNIDLLRNNLITNISDIKKKIMTGSKSANHIFFKGNFAYISYSFGVVVVDLDKNEIKDTYIIGDAGENYEVFSVAADDVNIYAATTKGIFSADINDPFLVNYSRWHRVTGFPDSYGKFDKLCFFNGHIIANYYGVSDNTDELYYFDGNVWTRFLNQASIHKHEIRASGNSLFITGNYHLYQIGMNMQITNDLVYSNFQSTLMDETGNIWIADDGGGLLLSPANVGGYKSIYPAGPGSENVWRMLFQNGSLYVTGGGINGSWNPTWNRGELFQFSNQTWSNIRNEMGYDYSTIAIDPKDPQKVIVGSWLQGVFVYKNGVVTDNYTYTNSPLQTLIPGLDYVYVCGTAFDDKGNLWITNSRVSSPLLVHKVDGTWKTFALGNYLKVSDEADITRDNGGRFWVVLPRGYGLFVFDCNGTIDLESDDRYLKFKPKSAYGEVINNTYCTVVDNDGAVWVGTDHGVVEYSNPDRVLDGETDGVQPTIPRNDGKGTVDPLLYGETVNCIAVDGANRKWLGTEGGGAFLVSADGTKQIYNFNVDNSPILSNAVRSIAIDDKTGEVFFGTDKGIIAYRSSATKGGDDFNNVYVYPDPVRDSYHGNITITGLVTNTIVKITDISGNLVFETKSLGGQAVWDGNMVSGRRVATGVYLVFLSSEDGTKTYVTKMLVIH